MKKVVCYFVIMCFSLACPGMAVLPAALAAELTSGEEQVMFSKEVLQKTLNNIKTNLAEGLPSTTELIFLEDLRNELKRQLAEVESMAAEFSLTPPDIDMTEFEAEFTEKMDNAKRMIYMLDNIIINPSIEEIDSALELLEILDPEVQGEILAVKPELPNRMVDTKANVFKTRPVKATGAPVTEADLAETDEIIITPAIEALALELNHDVVDIFTWVKFNIDYEPYYGSMKGSNETLVDMAGNDCDTSSLLLALLRASGIPSRYVRGDVELRIEDLMNWTGGKTPGAAIEIMQRNKIPITPIYKFDAIEGAVFDHIWVEAFNGHNWRLMDPSFKTYVYTEGEGIDIDVAELESLREATVTTVGTVGNVVSIDQEAIKAFTQTLPKVGDEVLSKREIFVSEKNNLPPYLARGIIGDRKPAEEFSTMPESMQVQVRVIMPGGNEVVMPLATIAGKRVSLVYVGAYPGHQAYIDSVGGIYNLRHPYTGAIVMKPVLQIDGETVAEGTFIGLGRTGQSVRVGFLRPGIYDPSNPVWEETNKPVLSGNRYNISITTQKTSTDELLRLGDEAEKMIAGFPLDGYLTDEMIDEKLRLSGMFYFSMVDELSDQISKLVNVVAVSHISMGYVCDEVKPVWEYFLWWPLYVKRIDKAGSHIDVVRGVKCPTSTIGNRADEVTWMKMVGAVGTNMEHAMIEIVNYTVDNKIEAVSTVKIFYKASEQGIPIHIIKKETLVADLGRISAHSVVKNHIHAYVNAGYIAMIPQRGITVGSWSGQGWIVMDEATGAAGYMICGGFNNENTIVNGGSGTTIIDNPVSTFQAFIMKLIPGLGCINVATMIMYATAKLFGVIPVSILLGGILFSYVFILLGTALLIAAFTQPPISILIRRREYAYA